MHETDDDVQTLARLIDHSNASAGQFLRSSFEIPGKTLSAEQLIRRLQGTVTLAMATVTSMGKPRSAPVIAIFYRGRFHIPTVRTALRTRHVLNNPAVSLSIYEETDFAVVVHGSAVLVGPDKPEFIELVKLQRKHNGSDVREWGDPVFIRVDPSHLYSFARYPDRFPGEPLTTETT